MPKSHIPPFSHHDRLVSSGRGKDKLGPFARRSANPPVNITRHISSLICIDTLEGVPTILPDIKSSSSGEWCPLEVYVQAMIAGCSILVLSTTSWETNIAYASVYDEKLMSINIPLFQKIETNFPRDLFIV